MTVSRRLFLGGALTLSALTAAPAMAGPVPVLWGDDIHDDAPALNALLRGKPIRVMRGRIIQGAEPVIADATLFIREPIRIPQDGRAVFIRCHIRSDSTFRGEAKMIFGDPEAVPRFTRFTEVFGLEKA